MELKDVRSLDDYEEYMKEQGPEAIAVLEKCERIARAVSAAMEALQEIHMGMCTYDLDEMPETQEGEIEDDEDTPIAAVV